MPEEFQKLPQSVKFGFCVILSFLAYLVWEQHHWWATVDDYSFGYLVPLFAAYVVLERWGTISAIFSGKSVDGKGSTFPPEASWFNGLKALAKPLEWLAYVVIFFCLIFFLIGAVMRAAQGPTPLASLLMSVGFGFMFISGLYLLSDRDSSGSCINFDRRMGLVLMFIFPAFIWVMSAPLLTVLHKKVSVFLLNQVSKIVFFVFELIGLSLVREGNILHLPTGDVGVAEACSGIRSLTACLFAGSFLAAVFLKTIWKKVMLVVSAMIFAFITNIFRSLFLTSWAYAYGATAINDEYFGMSIHDWAGFSVLGLTCVGLVILLPVFNFQMEYDEKELDQADPAT